MSHELSETVKIGNRWFNRDTVGKDKGRVLGSKNGFKTREEAESAARARSKRFRSVHSPRPDLRPAMLEEALEK